MMETKRQPTNCHVCDAPVFVCVVDTVSVGAAVVSAVRPVPPARACEVCVGVTCVNCAANECPDFEDNEP